MDKEKQRIAIAEACGWHRVNLPEVLEKNRPWCFSDDDEADKWRIDSNLPDYTGSLDLMHEAEKIIGGMDRREKYLVELHNVMGFRKAWKPSECFSESVISAPAHQRAEAFLRTIGKWEE